MTEGHFTPVLNHLFPWDEMSTGTCRIDLPWSSKLSDMVSYLRSKNIDRVLAWGDSTGKGQCRFESAAGGVRIANKSSNRLVRQLLTLFFSFIEPLAESQSRLYTGEEGFFSAGRKRVFFNACIDLRDSTSTRMVVHLSAACGLVYMLNASPRSAAGTTPHIAREEETVRA